MHKNILAKQTTEQYTPETPAQTAAGANTVAVVTAVAAS